MMTEKPSCSRRSRQPKRKELRVFYCHYMYPHVVLISVKWANFWCLWLSNEGLDANKILLTMKSLMEWYALLSLHSKLLTTVRIRHFTNTVFFSLHLLFFNKKVALSSKFRPNRISDQLPSDEKVLILSERGCGLVSICTARERKTAIADARYSRSTCTESAKRHYLSLFDLRLKAGSH